jgi:hypothetical protein
MTIKLDLLETNPPTPQYHAANDRKSRVELDRLTATTELA